MRLAGPFASLQGGQNSRLSTVVDNLPSPSHITYLPSPLANSPPTHDPESHISSLGQGGNVHSELTTDQIKEQD